jgi:hypothetical protein
MNEEVSNHYNTKRLRYEAQYMKKNILITNWFVPLCDCLFWTAFRLASQYEGRRRNINRIWEYESYEQILDTTYAQDIEVNELRQDPSRAYV